MEDILTSTFLKILNMSMTASYVILAVIIVRLLLGRAPKKYFYALWAVAAFRLCCHYGGRFQQSDRCRFFGHYLDRLPYGGTKAR